MDSAETWDEFNGNPPDTFDYLSVVTQEVGHALGLGHDDDLGGTNIMNGSYTGEVAEYSTNDEEHTQAVYGDGVGAPVDIAPTVDITSPSDGDPFTAGATIGFGGTTSDTEDGILSASLVWTSSIDGQIAPTASSPRRSAMGTTPITASVTNLGGNTVTQSVSILVGDAPAVATSVSVDSISYATQVGKNGDKYLSVTVAILDDLGNPSSGALVLITLKKSATGTYDRRTDLGWINSH